MMAREIISAKNSKIFDMLFCRAKDNVFTELDGETVILDISSGIYNKLDAIGTFIWNQLEEKGSQLRAQSRIETTS